MSYIAKIKNLDNREVAFEENDSLESILKKVEKDLPYPVYVAKLDNAYRALTHLCTHDCTIEFLDLRNSQAWLVYQNSLTLLFIKCVHDILGPKVLVTVKNSLNKGLYITLNHHLEEEEVRKIEDHMHEIVEKDLPIVKEHYNKYEAIRLAKSLKQEETVRLLESITNIDDIEIYSLEDEVQIFYNLVVPSCGYLKLFALKQFKNGVILRYPHPQDPNVIAEYVDQKQMYDAFSEANRWGKLMGVNFAVDLNESIISGRIEDLFLLQEALHEKRISDIADMIKEKGSRVVLICGPSSSGKTTFAKRLCIQLGVNGFKTLYIGTDDYYKELHERVYDEDGEPDLESIRAIDTDLFQNNLIDLLEGREADLPHYNFNTNKKEFGKRIVKLEKNQLIVIEGIHGLNRQLTERVDDAQKFKIYISPLTPVAIDHHNRLSTTDVRMLRRMVRDYKFRNRSAEGTIAAWPKVRAGEDTNIFPFNSEADVFFNSNCIYEIAVIKKYAEPLLKRIRRNQDEYAEAQRMLSFLKYFDFIYDESDIVNNSIIREFIGGSVIVKN